MRMKRVGEERWCVVSDEWVHRRDVLTNVYMDVPLKHFPSQS
jgi:hypothetical protein